MTTAIHLASASEPSENFVSFTVAPWIWVAFVGFVSLLLVVDLLLVHRTAHVISTKEAAIESAIWIAIGVAFTGVIFWWHGSAAAGEYISGYLIEKSLSVDNVFVWALIMSYFAVPREYQFRVLFWGVFGALVLRFIFIFAGVSLLNTFEWMLFVFGGLLLFTALRLLRQDEEEVHPEKNPALRLIRKVVPSTTRYDGQKLFTRIDGRLLATPLLAVLVVVETSDVVFAVDSIPAILAVSREQFIVFSSNAFAILGLRSLYFLLADLRDRFQYLQQGLAVILAFVGVKMIIAEWYHIPTPLSLAVIATVLAVSIGVSWFVDRGEGPAAPAEVAGSTNGQEGAASDDSAPSDGGPEADGREATTPPAALLPRDR